jgi:hypothetical protein
MTEDSIMTAKEWRAELEKFALRFRSLAQPIDFADLETRGIITKAGARYIVHDIRKLPAHATDKIYEFGEHDKGLIVKFRKPSKEAAKLAKRLEKQIEKLDAQHLNPEDQIRVGFKK